jgi:hypothetical protein
MASLPIPRSIFLTVVATTAGTWTRILPTTYSFGKLHSLVITRTAGLAVTSDVRIAYDQNITNPLDAIYIANGVAVQAPFSDVLDPAQMFGTGNKDGLWLYLDPNADSTFEVRIDIELMAN